MRARSCPSCHSIGTPRPGCADEWHKPAERAGYLIVLSLPPGMTPEQAQRELGSCISFGDPEISLQWLLPAAREGG